MKLSEMIKSLLDFEEVYGGDLDVTISLSIDGRVITSEQIYIAYEQREEGNEVNIRSFPY